MLPLPSESLTNTNKLFPTLKFPTNDSFMVPLSRNLSFGSVGQTASLLSGNNLKEATNLTPRKSSSRLLNTPTKSPREPSCSDRFIPVRNDMFSRKLIYNIPDSSSSDTTISFLSEEEQNQVKYQALLEGHILGLASQNSSTSTSSGLEDTILSSRSSSVKESNGKILQFKTPAKEDSRNSLSVPVSSFKLGWESMEEERIENLRKIKVKPYKVLDAPQLEDDYYLNLLDWSNSNVLAVALQDAIHLWSGSTGKVTQLCEINNGMDIFTGLSWNSRADLLATGMSNGMVNVWDFNKMKSVRSDFEPHIERIGCLAWNDQNLLATGSKDRTILVRDLRIRGLRSTIMKFKGHKQEICGLKWSPNDFQLASGGNDNKLYIWNSRIGDAEACFSDHKAAVKALTWSPHQSGLLMSGGGNNDKTIKVWNTHTMKMIKSVNAGSQVCNMAFSKNSNEFVTTHGFSNNHVIVWNYPDFTKLGVMEGHTSRVLYLAISPDGENVVTGAGASDETLRFWNVFPPAPKGVKSTLLPSSIDLR